VREEGDADADSPRKAPRTYDRKSSFDRAGKRPPFASKPSFGGKPSFGSKPRFSSDRPSFKSDRPPFKSDRPSFRRSEGSSDSRPPRREFTPRPYQDSAAGDSSSDRPRKTFSKPGTFARKREGFAGKPGFSRDSDSRPPRRDFPTKFSDKPDRAARSSFAKPSFDGPRKPGSYAPRPKGGSRDSEGDRSSGFAPRKPYTPREGAAGRSRFGDKPAFSRDRGDREARGGSYSDRPKRSETRGDGPPFRKFDAPRKPRPFSSDRPAQKEGSAYAGKPNSSFGAKKPFSKSGSGSYAPKSSGSYPKKSGSSFAGKKPYAKGAEGSAGKPASTFDKFKGNKKPFGKRAPARKFKPEEGQSAE
jgi:hypothetical protein